MTLKSKSELTPQTVANYRSKLKQAAELLAATGTHPVERIRLKNLIARIQKQLGIVVSDVKGPGRPRKE